MKRLLGTLIFIVVVAISPLVMAEETVSPVCDTTKDTYCFQPVITRKLDAFGAVNLPKIAIPAWMTPTSTPVTQEVTYTVATRGSVTADLVEFRTIAANTYNSPLGWSRLGVKFTEVPSGGRVTLWLSEASQMTTFSANGCDTTYSCTVGANVIINQDRWVNGSEPFMSAGGSLLEYREMVLNHELGHWLGHGHLFCASAGQDAPVMQQQSMGMQGCKPNPWPQSQELNSSTLGVHS